MGHKSDGHLLANDLGEQVADQRLRWEGPCILVGEGKPKPVNCDALRVGLPTDKPMNMTIEAGREKVHPVGTHFSSHT